MRTIQHDSNTTYYLTGGDDTGERLSVWAENDTGVYKLALHVCGSFVH